MRFKCYIPYSQADITVMETNGVDIDEFYLSWEEFCFVYGEDAVYTKMELEIEAIDDINYEDGVDEYTPSEISLKDLKEN